MANKDAPRSVPPMTECPPNAARSREIAAIRAAALQGAHQPTPEPEESGPLGGPASSWPSGLSVGVGVDYVATGRVRGALAEDSASKLLAPIVMLQVGWLDSTGRIWGLGEITTEALGGASLTPLLVQVSHD